jgi:hypothetical protein
VSKFDSFLRGIINVGYLAAIENNSVHAGAEINNPNELFQLFPIKMTIPIAHNFHFSIYTRQQQNKYNKKATMMNQSINQSISNPTIQSEGDTQYGYAHV